MTPFTRPKRISLKNHPVYSENWVQDIIADDPSILGLGKLVLRDRERIHPRAGRLDLLLQDPSTYKRYEVELQLGATDETHIIRTIEYWDIERKRYPQYEHCAVIVAEDITSRFLSVVSLFNGALPIMAIQMQAYEVGEHITLVFTKVLDEVQRGLVDEDEDAISAPTDRAYWEKDKGTDKTVALMDRIFALVKEGDPDCELKYNKFYVGLIKDVSECAPGGSIVISTAFWTIFISSNRGSIWRRSTTIMSTSTVWREPRKPAALFAIRAI